MTSRQWKFAFVQALTLGRAPLIFVFFFINLLLLRNRGDGWYLIGPNAHAWLFWIAFGAMVVSTLTDIFDGYFARKFDMVTKMGAYADPLTDKIFYLVTFPTLVFVAAVIGEYLQAGIFLLLTVIFLLRDQWVSFLRSIGAIYGASAKANWSGKWRTIIAFSSICGFYWYLLVPSDWWLQLPLWLVLTAEALCLAINIVSMWVYTRNYWRYVMQEMRKPAGE